MTRVLIAGVSTRAAAESAVRAGFVVTTIDAFADLDLHPAIRGVALPRDVGVSFNAQAAARAAAAVPGDVVVYASNFENHPDAVTALAADRVLWGNPPSVLLRVRDPLQLARAFRQRGISTPEVRINDSNGPNDSNPEDASSPSSDPGAWLRKPLSSGGGRGVRPWGGGGVPRGCYLQQRIEGVPGSLVFVAAGGRSVPLGVSRQLTGDPAFGADLYRYCGSILAPAGDPQFERDEALVDALSAVVRAATEEFDLVGLNGIDFISAGGVPYPIELNPRWSASMELVERAFGVSMFGAHASACASASLPAFDLSRARRRVPAVGKAIVFARTDLTMGDTRGWLEDSTVRDVPHPGERIAAGCPICTVFADGADAAGCYEALVQRAERIGQELVERT